MLFQAFLSIRLAMNFIKLFIIGELSMQRLLEQTPILDYYHASIQNLIEQRKWRDLDEVNKVRNIYNFVRDEVQFGYNTGDTMQGISSLKRRLWSV